MHYCQSFSVCDLFQLGNPRRVDELADGFRSGRVKLAVVERGGPVPLGLRSTVQLGLLVVDGMILEAVFDDVCPHVPSRQVVD